MKADKLKGKIVEQRLTQEKLASAIGINPCTLNKKLNGSSDFTLKEIESISCVLGLSQTEIMDIFFAD